MLRAGQDFDWRTGAQAWAWRGPDQAWLELPLPGLAGRHQLDNAAAVLAALHQLRDRLPVPPRAIRTGLVTVSLAGRLQRVAGPPECLLDVSHNPDGIGRLADYLRSHPVPGRNLAVVAMLSDKQHREALVFLDGQLDHWLLAGSDGPRGCPASVLQQALPAGVDPGSWSLYASVDEAWVTAGRMAGAGNRIVVFGSFQTVAAVMTRLQSEGRL